ncbi:hypothetical protein BSL78_20920 [Apostichopus japonicus]|uniref:UDENN FLCN/SMCR8-type domain-containing protein n=1 Tax=Stichopus japonicus TaxID=307972 RepID=A0A2G8K2H5_STIJA|nr:hypothetical protein BSL78_20920 [Apostichopus japonicus]
MGLISLHVKQSNNEAMFRHRNRAGRTDSFLMETPSSCLSITSDSTQQSFPLSYDAEFVPGSTAASLESIYYDVEEGLDDGDEEKTQDNDDSWLEISFTSRGEERTENNDENRGLGGSFDVVSINSHSEVESVDLSPHQLMNGGTVPFVNGYDKVVQLRQLSSSSSIEPVLSRCSKVPVGCYASRLTSTNTDLPGADIRAFLHTYPFAGHLIYALLSGRTTIIAASPKREKEVYSIIRTLRLFVPGHSSNQLIIPWHTMSLTMCDLGRMKLVGLAKPRSLHRAIPASVFRFSTVFDYDSSKLWTPPYRETPSHWLITCPTHTPKCAQFPTVAPNIMRTSSFWCMQNLVNLTIFTSEKQSQLTAAHFLAKINAIDGDAKIVQYWVDIIKQQQISEFLTQTNSSHVTKKMPIKLNYEGSKLYHA